MKKKTTFIVFALFLGFLGIHRFYLGQHKKGLLYICFCWTLIPAIISFIDAIQFAIMKDAVFYCKYNLKIIERFGVRKGKITIDELQMQLVDEKNLDEEKRFVEEIERLDSKEKIREYLMEAKKAGKYLPRFAYTRAIAMLEDKPWNVNTNGVNFSS